jgi:type III secretion system low calcium response chaperone LcrH/SycD
VTTPLLDISTPEGMADAMLHHGITLADTHGISADDLEAVYSKAYEDIEAGRFDEALEGMAFLTQHDPWESRYQFSFALCLHNLGDYQSAGHHYAQALLMDATNAVCSFRMGECLGALGQLAEAREAFESTVALSYLKTEYADVRDLAQQRLDALTGLGA